MSPSAESGMDVDFAQRQLRLAVVMTGGVSLAVWIGGVAAEIHRAVRSEGIYGALNEALRTTVVVDVITGASAGGVNGAFLATAVALPADGPTDDRFDVLRNVWLESGAISALLRPANQANPPSLLQGDSYFLPQLKEAITSFIPLDQRTKLDAGELRLVMTTTTLKPEMVRYTDDLGAVLYEPINAATFCFDGSTFADSQIAAKLALAARSSASFPGAFEPSFIPVGPGADTDDLHPDMAGIASFGQSRWVVDGGVLMNKPVAPALEAVRDRVAQSEVRRVLVYVNPDPSDGPPANRLPDDRAVEPTFSAVVTKSVFSLPRVESIAADLREIAGANHKLSMQRSTRSALLIGLRIKASGSPGDDESAGSWEVDAVDVPTVAADIYSLWLRRRSYRAVEKRLALLGTAGNDPNHTTAGVDWQEFASALRFERGRRGWLASRFPGTPGGIDLRTSDAWRFGLEPIEYICSVMLDFVRQAYALLPANTNAEVLALRAELGTFRSEIHRQRTLIKALRELDDYYWRTVLAELRSTDPYAPSCQTMFDAWPMLGSTPAAPNTYVVADPARPQQQLMRALELLRRAATADEWEAVTTAVLCVDTTLEPLTSPLIRNFDTAAGQPTSAVAGQPTSTVTAQAAGTLAGHLFRQCEQRIAVYLSELLAKNEVTLIQAASIGANAPQPIVADGGQATPPEILRRSVQRVLHGSQPGITLSAVDVVRYLLALYIVQDMADDGVEDREVRVDFVQISADNPSPISQDLLAADKVAGLQVGHFGGFLKEAWRANDWMWGTLDGAARVVDVLVEGNRIAQCYFDSAADPAAVDRATEDMFRIATGQRPDRSAAAPCVGDAGDVAFLQGKVDREAIRREMQALFDKDNRVGLSETRRSIGLAVQLMCAQREIPEIVKAILQSTKDGAAESRAASALIAGYNAVQNNGALSLVDTNALMPTVRQVAHERLKGEYGSDALSATIAQSASVFGNLLSSDAVGIGFVRKPLKIVRYGLRALSLSTAAAIRDTRTTTAFKNLLLAAVGVCVALAIVGVDLPRPVSIGAIVAAGGWLALNFNGVCVPVLTAIATVVVVLIVLGPTVAQQVFASSRTATTPWAVAVAAVALFAAAAVVEIIRQWMSDSARVRSDPLTGQTTRIPTALATKVGRVVRAAVAFGGTIYVIAGPLRLGPWHGGGRSHISLIAWFVVSALALASLQNPAPRTKNQATTKKQPTTITALVPDRQPRRQWFIHGGHAVIISAAGLLSFWFIRWVTVGGYRVAPRPAGSLTFRERFVDVVSRAHDIRWVLVIGIPALIVGLDLLAGWLKKNHVVTQRVDAVEYIDRNGIPGASIVTPTSVLEPSGDVAAQIP